MVARGTVPDLAELLSWFPGACGYILELLSRRFIICHDLLKLRLSRAKWPNLKQMEDRICRLVLMALLGAFLKYRPLRLGRD